MGAQPNIETYTFGHIVIDGKKYSADVIILPGDVKSNWWRGEGHVLKPGDLSAVLEASPKILVVGQGAYGYMKVPEETLAHLTEAGIEIICLPTADAVDEYNQRAQQNIPTAAALHLTC